MLQARAMLRFIVLMHIKEKTMLFNSWNSYNMLLVPFSPLSLQKKLNQVGITSRHDRSTGASNGPASTP